MTHHINIINNKNIILVDVEVLEKCIKKLDTKHRESYLSTTEDKNGCLIGSIKLNTQKGFFSFFDSFKLAYKEFSYFHPITFSQLTLPS